jgi:hypothetical protein
MGFLSFSDANYTFFSSLARDHRGSNRTAIGVCQGMLTVKLLKQGLNELRGSAREM